MTETNTFQRSSPTCPNCGHALNTDEMLCGKPMCDEDLFGLALSEGTTVIQCPLCDKEYWVKGGYAPQYTSAFSEEELE